MAVGMFAIVCVLFAVWLPLEPIRYGFREIRFVDDVVAVEHCPRLPAAELHELAVRSPWQSDAGRANPGRRPVPGV